MMNRRSNDGDLQDDATVSTDVDRNTSTIFPIEIEGAEASFPAAEEVRSSLPRDRTNTKRKNRYLWMIAITSIVVFILLVALTRSGRGARSSDTGSGSAYEDNEKAKEEAKLRPRPSLESVIAYLTRANVSDQALFGQKISPQYAAARFLAEEDGANLVVPGTDSPFLTGYRYVFRYTMAVLYYSCNGENWKNNPGFLSDDDACLWYATNEEGTMVTLGVYCVLDFDGRYTPIGIGLGSNNLQGTIPKELGALGSLRGFDFWGNELSSTIPTELCSLPHVRYIGLNHNKLVGSLPACLGKMTTLTSLLLSNNAFVGTLPASFSQLTLLRELLIDDNNLTGDPIPVLNALPLWILMANKNNFTAKIDSSFLAGNPFLTWVDVSHNGFYSKDFFPEHLFRKPLLEVLDFGHNRLSGNVSANVSNARALLYLALNDNRLTGPLTGFSNLKSLRRLDVSNNMLTGDMDAIGSLPSLYLLFLSGNPFTPGTIPKSFTNLVNLTELSLRNTNRVGPLPEFVNPRLELLDLGSNNLNSTVPESYAQFPNLTYILLNNNTNIRGSLPAAFSELRTLKGGFFDGTDLNANTIEILCRHDNFATVESDEVITADCVTCPCNQIVCKCCPPEDVEGCSRPLLAGVDMSWENLFQREKYSFRNVSADGGGGNTSPGWVGSE